MYIKVFDNSVGLNQCDFKMDTTVETLVNIANLELNN